MKIKLYLCMYPYMLKYLKPEDMTNHEKVLGECSILTKPPHEGSDAFLIGEMEVDVELELISSNQIINSAVIKLRQKAADIRAEAQMKANVEESLAQQLLAIEHTSTLDSIVQEFE